MTPFISNNNVQTLKILNTPKLPDSLFTNAQPINIRVLSTQDNQATVLIAGKQLQIQTNQPLTPGQLLSAQPLIIDGQKQLKLLPDTASKPDTAPNKGTPSQTASTGTTTSTNAAALKENQNTLRVINTPKLPASLFETPQPITIQVLRSQNNQATIMLAGRPVQTQTNTALQPGQVFKAMPEMVNGQLQLTLLTDDDNNPSALTEPDLPTDLSLTQGTKPTTAPARAENNQPQDNTPTAKNKVSTENLPAWTNTLPNKAKEALSSIRQTLPTQIPLQTVFQLLNQQLPNLLNKSETTAQAWQTLINTALALNPAPSPEKIQQSINTFNAKLAQEKQIDTVKSSLSSILNDPNAEPVDKQMAQGMLNKSEQNQQLQQLHHLSGHPIFMQDIPIRTDQGLDNFTLEIDIPKPGTETEDQQWKIFIQLALEEGDFTSRIQMDAEFNVKIQLWGSTEQLTNNLQTGAANLKKALNEQGLNISSMIIANGKPEAKSNQPAWHQPLVDVHG